MAFQDSRWNISMSSLVNLDASVLIYRVEKHTDKWQCKSYLLTWLITTSSCTTFRFCFISQVFWS